MAALRHQRGFTLIELLIVVAIIGVLAAVLIPNLFDALSKSRQKRTLVDMRGIGNGWMSWLTDQVGAASAGQEQKMYDASSQDPVGYEELYSFLHPTGGDHCNTTQTACTTTKILNEVQRSDAIPAHPLTFPPNSDTMDRTEPRHLKYLVSSRLSAVTRGLEAFWMADSCASRRVRQIASGNCPERHPPVVPHVDHRDAAGETFPLAEDDAPGSISQLSPV